ncbi:putative HNHc nuclease [Furfurilactobacillus sp. WILCCON 0119]
MDERVFLKLTPKLFADIVDALDPVQDQKTIHRLAKLQGGLFEAQFRDERKITADQRAKIFAMIRDYCKSQYGWPFKETLAAAEMDMKLFFWEKTKREPFSFSDCSIDAASDFIEFLIEFFYEWKIPWARRTWDLLQGDPGRMYYGIKYRVCCICGNEAQWAHVHTVGMGRPRTKVDHRGNYVMPICVKHHNEQHNIGIWTFMDKYHIKGVKVDDEINAMLQYKHFSIDDTEDGDKNESNYGN